MRPRVSYEMPNRRNAGISHAILQRGGRRLPVQEHETAGMAISVCAVNTRFALRL